MSVITEYPGWFVLLCVAAGLVYAGALYLHDRFNRTYGTALAWILGALRFTGIFLLAFFLLKPLLRLTSHDVQKPILVVAVDNSQSLVLSADSARFRNGTFAGSLQQLISQFGDGYEVMTYEFGESVNEGLDSLNFEDKVSDISGLADDLYNRLNGRNLGAVILASDGLYNRGSNPVQAFQKLKVPVYTLALGDTTVRRDVLIADAAHNRLAYLGNKFPVEITVQARRTSGATLNLTVSGKKGNLFSETIQVNGSSFSKTTTVLLEAEETGIQRYTIQVTPVQGEVTLLNNRKDIFVDVLDTRQKVLIAGASPHPDMGAIADALRSQESYQVESVLASEAESNTAAYSLIVCHQLPAANGLGMPLIRDALSRNIPVLFVWGAQTDYQAFNDLQTGFALEGYSGSLTDMKGVWSEGFSLFNTDEQTRDMFPSLPPLSVPFGDFSFSPGASAALMRQVGSIKTQTPLIAFNKLQDNKVGLVSGEGLWRWKLLSYAQFESHEPFTQFVTKSVQYLASREDKSFFRVNGDNDFDENENIIFSAELYNESYEPLNDREVSMVITNENGDAYNYTFSAVNGQYRLDAGQLPVGNYRYTAKASNGVQEMTVNGQFSVSPLLLESLNTVADHILMNQIAQENGGQMVLPDQMSTLPEQIAQAKTIRPMSFENTKLNDLIDYKWLLVIIIAMFGLEWLLRKRAGTY